MICILAGACALLFAAVCGINLYMTASVRKQVLSPEEASRFPDADCILVLGAAVWAGDVPCPILHDRLLTGIFLYKKKAAPSLLMSGGSSEPDYDEPRVMRRFAVERGVPPDAILSDAQGFTTFDSILRLKTIFGIKRVIIVTQRYHLYRSLFIARRLGLEAVGAVSDRRRYRKRLYRELREAAARVKYLFLSPR